MQKSELDTKELEKTNAPAMLSPSGFELAQRMAGALSKSSIIPEIYKDNIPNCLIALEMANRMNASPMMVMQNLYIVHGRPAWSGQFIIAAINSTGKFSPLRFKFTGEGDKRECVAWAKELSTDEVIEGPPVSIDMAKAEGWHGKNGSKWKTMPEVMLRYRSATFFGRIYAPEVLMGMREESEIIDIDVEKEPVIRRAKIVNLDGKTAAEASEQREPELQTGEKHNDEPAPTVQHEKKVESLDSPKSISIKSTEPKLEKKTKKKTISEEVIKVQNPENEPPYNMNLMLKRLEIGGFTVEQLHKLCVENEWNKGQDWPYSEQILGTLIESDNIKVIMEELEALK